jgi:Subtilase family
VIVLNPQSLVGERLYFGGKVIARVVLATLIATAVSSPCRGDVPYPLDPQPCRAPAAPPECIPAAAYSHYLFLPATTPLTLPNDFGPDNWKLTSEPTGEAAIDTSPQELFGVKGASVDRAWQVTTGRPDVLIAVLDSGIRWQDPLPDLVNKVFLNRGELPPPEGSTNGTDPWDRNGDGVFNVRDYLADDTHVQDSRVSDQNGNGTLDPEDLIFVFSDGTDADHNGYVDDIAGWDFFEDDNDPLDEVGYGHGTGEAQDSVAEANNASGDVGTCPSCMVMPVRVGDSFVAEVDNFAQGVLFATDSGARVIQEALGSLNNSSFAQAAIDYADRRGVIVVASAADEESNHHNYPANYNHTLEVNSVTKFNDLSGLRQTPHSYLYLNGCTNYGGHIALSVPSSSCSSEATGKSAGMAALVYAAALNEIDRGHLTRYPNGDGTRAPFALSANEIKQLLTTTADDINFAARPDAQPPLPENYTSTSPFPGVLTSERYHSIAGWDQYFGYGRINADSAVRRVAAGRIPPEAEITSPAWFEVINPDQGTLMLHGRAAANRATMYGYTVEIAPGIQPAEADFVTVSSGDQRPSGSPPDVAASISLQDLAARMPHGVDGPAVDADGQPDPDRFSFTVRIRAFDTQGNRGEDRRAFFLHRDPDLIGGAPRLIGSDGAAAPVIADLGGDGFEGLILATSDGEVHAYSGTGRGEYPGWPVHTEPIELHADAAAFKSAGEVPATVYAPILGGPAVGDLDHDGRVEVVAADYQGKLYVWNHDGTLRPGFPVSTNAAYSFSHRSERDPATPDGRVPDRTNRHNADNRLHRGFGAGPALGNLDGSTDGSLEIIIGANDRHVYAWHNDGSPVPGWPVLLKDPSKVESVDPTTNEVVLTSNAKAEIGTKITTPASLGDIDGDGWLDVVVGVNEEYSERLNALITNLVVSLYRATGVLNSGNGRVYALFHDGTMHGAHPLDHGWNPDAFMPGWPVKPGILKLGLLPTVGSGINGPPALADLDKDGRDEVAVFSFLGPAYIFNGSGHSFFGEAQPGIPRTLEVDTFGTQSNSVDAPAFPSLGGGALAEMSGPGRGFQFIAPISGLGKLIDSNLAAHQLPADNQLAVWDVANADGTPGSAKFRPAFPRVVNDLQFLTAPAVAEIDGDGLPEALEGSGVYDVHAINANGVEPAGWPKFTGGWVTASPTVGDIDGDGRLDVVTITREGRLFIWKTTADACSPAPWRKAHHDERNSGNYRTDARLPARLETPELIAVLGEDIDVVLKNVPGDDLYCGAAAGIDARYSLQPIDTEAAFAAATPLQVISRPATPCRQCKPNLQLHAPFAGGAIFIAVRAVDAAGNRSTITSIGRIDLSVEPSPTPTPVPTPTFAASPSPTGTAAPRASSDGCTLAPRASDTVGFWVGLALLVFRRLTNARRRERSGDADRRVRLGTGLPGDHSH